MGSGDEWSWCLLLCAHVCSYLATWDYPVGDSQEGQTYSDPQHCPALHPDRLLPQTGQVLVPDSQQLLLAVGMGDELERETRNLNQWRIKGEEDGSTGQEKVREEKERGGKGREEQLAAITAHQ